jgi:hypothetical protein
MSFVIVMRRFENRLRASDNRVSTRANNEPLKSKTMDDFPEPQSPRVTDSSSKAPSLATMLSQVSTAI